MEKQMVVLGQEVSVKNHVGYQQKMDAAEEYVAMSAVFDEEHGLCYMSPYEEAVKKYMKLKTYTGLDMSNYNGIDGLCRLMDDIDEVPIDEFEELVDDDWVIIYNLAYVIYCNVSDVFEKEHSLEHRVKTSFGFLLDGKDLTQTLAEAREVNEQMIDHLGAIAKTKTQPIDMAQYAKKRK